MSTPSLAQFENAAFEPGEFDHEAHVYVAWRYLQRYELLEAIGFYREGLQNLVRAFGAESKYHETITWFYMVSIAERMVGDAAHCWDSFRRSNPELLMRQPSWVGRHYSAGRLAGPRARHQFVLPDLVAT
jgi:hypothetical protein